MIARLLNPILFLTLALFISVGLSSYWFWMKASAILGEVKAVHQKEAVLVENTNALRRVQGWDFWTIEVSNLQAELRDQKLANDKKSERLAQSEKQLANERSEIERTRNEKKKMQDDLDTRMHEVKAGQIEIKAEELVNLKALASTYTGLTATAATAILKEMDDVTVVKLLSLMKKAKVIEIFQEMTITPTPDGGTLAKRAAVLSDKMRMLKPTDTSTATP
jgi:flagellar motility protein MotE (MotC chaperone)